MCAISSLNMAYGARATLEDAIQHYHSALAPGATPDDLLADGVFLRHILLFIYDICMPMTDDSTMWAEHLDHLKRIAILRKQKLGREPHAFIIWLVCKLDTYACLMGSGNCDFVRFVLQNNMLPHLEQQVPVVNPVAPYRTDEAPVFPAILAMRQNMFIFTAKLAQLAQACRREAAAPEALSPGVYAKWQAAVTQAQNELSTSWSEGYPDFLPPESVYAGANLPSRVRHVFEHVGLKLCLEWRGTTESS